jgi:hypothetical protein
VGGAGADHALYHDISHSIRDKVELKIEVKGLKCTLVAINEIESKIQSSRTKMTTLKVLERNESKRKFVIAKMNILKVWGLN